MGFGGSRDENLSHPPAIPAGRPPAYYLTGLCVTALGMCAGGWLVLTPFAFGYPGHGRAEVTALATGCALVAVCVAALACWAALWRGKLRADGVLPARVSARSRRSARRQARAERLVRATRQRDLVAPPDPAQVLIDLRELLTPLLADAPCAPACGDVEMVASPAASPDVVQNEHGQNEHGQDEHGQDEHGQDEHGQDEHGSADDAGVDVVGAGRLRGAELLVVGAGEEEAW